MKKERLTPENAKIFSLSGHQIYLWILDVRERRAKKKALLSALDRGDVSVSVETFSHMAEETVFEPHTSRHGKAVYTKTICMFYFEGGSSWRVPAVGRHYDWSAEYSLSREGLLNTSVKGNEFSLSAYGISFPSPMLIPPNFSSLART